MTMRLNVIGRFDRMQGKTTALVDLAIMNARSGARVEFWCTSFPNCDHAARICEQRIAIADVGHDAVFTRPSGLFAVEFRRVGGRLDFKVSDNRRLFGASRPWTGKPNIEIEDFDTGAGTMEINGVY